tara:strand:- start:12631 stop:13074 length:444 start_codon:yes stop_codon:yes gene_type:complete
VSRAYRNSSDVPLDAIIKRLHELSDAVVGGRKTQAQEFVMRVPAECDHDADLILAEAAVRLDALRKYNAELQAESVQAIANKVCGDLPDGWEINLCMENGSGWVEAIKPSGYTIEIDGGDLSLVEQINEAMRQALESQSDQPENTHD